MKIRVLALLCALLLLLTACASPQADLTQSFSEALVVAEGVTLQGYARDGAVYALAGDLSRVLPDFTWKKGIFGSIRVNYGADSRDVACTRDVRAVDGSRALYLPQSGDALLPLALVGELPSLMALNDTENGVYYLSGGLDHSAIQPGVTVPVLMYHCISDDVWGYEPMFVSPAEFRTQMRFLLDEGYTPILFSDLSDLAGIEKPVIITVDDGYKNNYTDMFPILKEYGIPATVFMIASFIGNEYYMTAEQMREMCDSGLVEFQSHTYEHLHLSDHGPEEQEQTMIQSQLAIARAVGRVPYVISYPQGLYDSSTEALAAKYYSLGARTQNALWVTDDGYYHINRLMVKPGLTLEEYAALLTP